MQQQEGLTSAEAAARSARYGRNEIIEKKRSLASRVVGWVATPISLMFAAAGGLSLWAGHDADSVIIAALFLTNIGVGAWHESKADTAVAALAKKLSVMVKVRRDSAWARLPSAELVPGDVIELSAGSLIPADVSLVAATNVSVNESALTGESLPKEKHAGDKAFSGSFLSSGLSTAVVSAIGSATYFGKTLLLVDRSRQASALERDILSISRFLAGASIALMAVLTVVLVLAHQPIAEIATLDVSMLIAGIPVALPTVMTLIISIGVLELSKRSAIVRRLSSLEDLANVDLLISDKTGTLTEDRIRVERMSPLAEGMTAADIWAFALAGSPLPDGNPLDAAIRDGASRLGFAGYVPRDFVPGDSERKRTTSHVLKEGRRMTVTLGAPQVVAGLCDFPDGARDRHDALVREAASQGFRVLSLAVADGEAEAHMRPLAVFFMEDAIRADAKDTIAFMNRYGIAVKMSTGDGYDIAAHVARVLDLPGTVVPRREVESDPSLLGARFESLAGFAEVLPKDKYDIVMAAKHAAHPHVVAVTGDGVNDVPPVRAADVGIAVSNAVDALKGAADIVLTEAGISVVKDAIIEARKIFVRLYNYSVYRISESFRLVVTVAAIGVMFGAFPLTPVQIILIALLNDVPIISLAFDRVTVPQAPARIDAKKRMAMSLAFGAAGIANSMIMLWLAVSFFHAPWPVIQTLFFLKLTVSGHMLVYVAHTERPWYRFLPSKQVILATTITQAIATALALLGIFVSPLSWFYVIFVWIWAFFWMQASELAKYAVHAIMSGKR